MKVSFSVWDTDDFRTFKAAGSECVPDSVKVDDADIVPFKQTLKSFLKIPRIYGLSVLCYKYKSDIRKAILRQPTFLLLFVGVKGRS